MLHELGMFNSKVLKLSVILGFVMSMGACVSLPHERSGLLSKGATKVLDVVRTEITAKNDERNDMDQIREKSSFIEGQQINKYINGVAAKLTRIAGIPSEHISLLNTSVVQGSNRMGSISLTKGMLFSIQSEDELASLIGHEIGHQALKHVSRKSLALQRSVFDLIKGELIKNDGIDLTVDEYTSDFLRTYYDRKDEEKADEFGSTLVARAGYNPFALRNLFNRLAQKAASAPLYRIKKLTASHAALDSRGEHLKKYLLAHNYKDSSKKEVVSRYEDAFRSYFATSPSKHAASSKTERRIEEVASIQSIVEIHKRNKRQFTPENFIELAGRLSKVVQALENGPEIVSFYSTRKSQGIILEKQGKKYFMEEYISEDGVNFRSRESELRSQILKTLEELTQLALSFAPLSGDAIDLFEVLAGKDFFTGASLSVKERLLGSVGLLVGSGAQWRASANEMEALLKGNPAKLGATELKLSKEALSEARAIANEADLYGRSKVGREYNVHIEKGPISEDVAENFLGGKYRVVQPAEGEVFYRHGTKDGSWWSRKAPESGIKAGSEKAVHPDWNNFDQVSTLEVPKGHKIEVYEGLAGPQAGKTLPSGRTVGTYYHGGTGQVYIKPDTLSNLNQVGSIKSRKL